jgi:hypothetical protein
VADVVRAVREQLLFALFANSCCSRAKMAGSKYQSTGNWQCAGRSSDSEAELDIREKS